MVGNMTGASLVAGAGIEPVTRVVQQ